MTIPMKAIEQYFLVALFIMLRKVVLTVECVDEIPKCTIQTKAIHSFRASYYAIQGGSHY